MIFGLGKWFSSSQNATEVQLGMTAVKSRGQVGQCSTLCAVWLGVDQACWPTANLRQYLTKLSRHKKTKRLEDIGVPKGSPPLHRSPIHLH